VKTDTGFSEAEEVWKWWQAEITIFSGALPTWLAGSPPGTVPPREFALFETYGQLSLVFRAKTAI